MTDQATNAVLAVGLGLVASVLLFVPTAAYQYRLDGRLAPRDLLVLVAAAVYGWALWTYTLLPAPADATYTCSTPELDPTAAVRPLLEADLDGPLSLLGSPAFLQLALNVALFVPLGVLVRVILRRGFVVATLLGLATSGLIELTQLTGVFGIFGCAYRLFDSADLVVNTAGALAGSLLAAVLVDTEARPRRLPTTITRGRRLVGLASEALVVVLLGGVAAAAYRIYALSSSVTYDADTQLVVQLAVPYAVQAGLVLARGRTVGELVVSVRAVALRPRRRAWGRVVKLLTGLTPAFVLAALGGWWTVAGLPAYLVVVAVSAMLGSGERGHRGLSHTLAGMDLRVETHEAFEVEREGSR